MIGVSVDCEHGLYTVGLGVSVTVGGMLRLARWGGHHHGVMVVNDECGRSVVFTEGLWFSQRVCGFHRGSVVFTEALWFSQRVCGVYRGSVVFTEGLWCSQRMCGIHRGSVVFTEGL